MPICCSWPCESVEPIGGTITPALFVKVSKRDSLDMNCSAAGLIEARLARSTSRKTILPIELGNSF